MKKKEVEHAGIRGMDILKLAIAFLGIGALIAKTPVFITKLRSRSESISRGRRKNKKPAYEGFYNLYVKRFLDIVISSIFLLLTLPFYLLVSAAILLEDGFPIFYRAERGGYKGKPFRIMKFRSMIKNADRVGGGTTALHDPRITRVGNILRKTKLDEFPQFIQVLTGEMSLIGPRPELLQYTNRYEGDEKHILMVRPGITDYSSLEFINLDEIVGGENADEMYEKYVLKRKNELRVKYAENVSFATDARIFCKTAYKVLEKIYSFFIKKEHH